MNATNFALCRQVREVGHLEELLADLRGKLAHLAVRPGEERVEQPKLVHHLHGGRMHGVAAKVAQEVAVLLQHHHIDAGAREQEAQHHAGRPAAGDAAASGDVGSCYSAAQARRVGGNRGALGRRHRLRPPAVLPFANSAFSFGITCSANSRVL